MLGKSLFQVSNSWVGQKDRQFLIAFSLTCPVFHLPQLFESLEQASLVNEKASLLVYLKDAAQYRHQIEFKLCFVVQIKILPFSTLSGWHISISTVLVYFSQKQALNNSIWGSKGLGKCKKWNIAWESCMFPTFSTFCSFEFKHVGKIVSWYLFIHLVSNMYGEDCCEVY